MLLIEFGLNGRPLVDVTSRLQSGADPELDAVSFSERIWLAPHHVNDEYFALLPTGATEVSAEEAIGLALIFGEGGEKR